jgi:hypothetical protein
MWLYIGVESGWNSGWDVYMQLRFDGNHDHVLAGNNYIPHTDIQVEYPSPGGWSGYNNYQYIVGSNAYSTTEPTGTQRGSSGSTNVTYEYSIKIEDLNVNNDNILGFYMLHGTDGTTEHGYEFPTNNIRNNPSQWAHVLLETSTNYAVAYSPIVPNIDGQIVPGEWQYANSYNITFYRTDGSGSHPGILYLQRDATWLYIGVESGWNSGWDVYMQLRFDGNHDHALNGNNYIPHTDIQVEYPSPIGWNGYNNYQYIVGSNAYNTEEPTGTQRGSYGSANVTYEYSIKILDLNVNNYCVFGFYILHGTDGTTEHGYEFPINNIRNNPSLWENVIFDPQLYINYSIAIENISVFPNPTNGIINILTKHNEIIPYDLTLVNSIGNIIYTNKINKERISIDLSNLIQGIYFIKIQNNSDITFNKKIIKL